MFEVGDRVVVDGYDSEENNDDPKIDGEAGVVVNTPDLGYIEVVLDNVPPLFDFLPAWLLSADELRKE